ncbi:hypothetical protein HDU93_008885 [Gonapodya sp. JEL0774]|nr:hypothetical protein HDU93_008885 [Gonapodya sp. JEL0774]
MPRGRRRQASMDDADDTGDPLSCLFDKENQCPPSPDSHQKRQRLLPQREVLRQMAHANSSFNVDEDEPFPPSMGTSDTVEGDDGPFSQMTDPGVDGLLYATTQQILSPAWRDSYQKWDQARLDTAQRRSGLLPQIESSVRHLARGSSQQSQAAHSSVSQVLCPQPAGRSTSAGQASCVLRTRSISSQAESQSGASATANSQSYQREISPSLESPRTRINESDLGVLLSAPFSAKVTNHRSGNKESRTETVPEDGSQQSESGRQGDKSRKEKITDLLNEKQLITWRKNELPNDRHAFTVWENAAQEYQRLMVTKCFFPNEIPFEELSESVEPLDIANEALRIATLAYEKKQRRTIILDVTTVHKLRECLHSWGRSFRSHLNSELKKHLKMVVVGKSSFPDWNFESSILETTGEHKGLNAHKRASCDQLRTLLENWVNKKFPNWLYRQDPFDNQERPFFSIAFVNAYEFVMNFRNKGQREKEMSAGGVATTQLLVETWLQGNDLDIKYQRTLALRWKVYRSTFTKISDAAKNRIYSLTYGPQLDAQGEDSVESGVVPSAEELEQAITVEFDGV